MLSHANAFTFLDWCDRTLPLRADDRFSSHAPFHFDLSVFDLFASCRARGDARPDRRGAGQGPGPARRVPGGPPDRASGTRRRRSWRCWRSTAASTARRSAPPGSSCSRARSSRSRRCGGSGRLWPGAAFWNLYGPTETNVCTAYPIPETIPDDRDEPFPIGTVCPPLAGAGGRRARARRRRRGRSASWSSPAPGVMRGYFGQPELTAPRLPPRRRRHRLVSHRRPGRRRRRRLLRLPRPPRPDGQEARLPDRAGRDRVGALPPRGGRPRRGGRQARRRRASRSPRSSR